MRVCFALPGAHRIERGAEVAFESVAELLVREHGCDVTLFGSGSPRPGQSYRYVQVPCARREKFEGWPGLPLFRDECAYEELSFAWRMRRCYRPADYDLTVACSYPYLNWLLRARRVDGRPAHVFVTQNGDWPAVAGRREYRFFSCDGLVCVNPQHVLRNRTRWRCALVPNGVDLEAFSPGRPHRIRFGIPDTNPVALMVGALISSKRLASGIRSVARNSDFHLVIAGDGPLRREIDALGRDLLGERFHRLTCPRQEMPGLFRCADVFLHLSSDEPFGIVYLEALAMGLPIVAQDGPTTRWLLEDQAWFVDGSDAASVSRALRAALAARDPESCAARRRLVSRRYTWPAVAAQYYDFFRVVAEAVRSG